MHAPLALTAGEPGGVGMELAAKAWRSLSKEGVVFFLIGDPDHAASFDAPVEKIAEPAQAASVMSRALPVLPIPLTAKAHAGSADPANAQYIIQSIEQAVALALAGEAGGVVTNPIQKSALLAAGFKFPGHTEFLGELTKNSSMPNARERGPTMMLAGPSLRTAPVTVHSPLRDAINQLTPGGIVKTAMVVAESLGEEFGIEKPRLAVSGLNPHAGEDGAMGAEDSMIIAPAIDELRSKGVDAFGPLPADTMFHEEARSRYDAAVCMYHDQALIPVKTLAFHETVNVTLGLPVIRTSPDHGTALDIAGKNIARPDSLIAAIRLAGEMAARRANAK